MRRPRVALATCGAFPALDDDDRLLLPALDARGIDAEPAVWDEPAVDWARFDLCVIRSTWDYPERHGEFIDWARRVDRVCGLANPADLVAWNTDKRYLRDLGAAGIPIVGTVVVEPGDDVDAALPPDGRYVVKPAVSAGSRDTARYAVGRDDEVARAHLAGLLAAGRSVLIQPYLDSVDEVGETALLYLGGRFSHAVRKGALLPDGGAPSSALFVPEDITPRTPDEVQRQVADAVMAALPTHLGQPLYARVDLLEAEGVPVLLEVELAEPSLFLGSSPGAADRFAAAIADLVGGPTGG